MKNLLILFVLVSFIFSCTDVKDGKDGVNGTNGTNGSDGTNGTDSSTDTKIVYNLTGNLQKGPCFKDGEIVIQTLDDGSLDQLGQHFRSFTKDNYGYYEIPAEITEEYAEVFFEGECHNEITGGSGPQRLSGIIKVADLDHNINPLTKISSQVTRWLFDDEFGTIEASIIEAERLILLYLGMPALTERFTEMNLEEDGTHDAILALSSSMLLYGRTEAEQGDYMVSIANGVINNDLTLKAEIASTIDILPLIQIKDNLESIYLKLGMTIDMPPIWNLGAPDYYADLLERIPAVTGTFNLDDTSNCSFDQSTYNTFAIPHIFGAGIDIEISKYIALNLDHDISLWTKGTHVNGHLAPETKLLDITQLKEIILDNPKKMNYNGLLGDHSLTNGTEYYIVIRSDNDFVLSTSCEGGFLPFGRKLASNDEGLNWIGQNNNTKWFRVSGISGYGIN